MDWRSIQVCTVIALSLATVWMLGNTFLGQQAQWARSNDLERSRNLQRAEEILRSEAVSRPGNRSGQFPDQQSSGSGRLPNSQPGWIANEASQNRIDLEKLPAVTSSLADENLAWSSSTGSSTGQTRESRQTQNYFHTGKRGLTEPIPSQVPPGTASQTPSVPDDSVVEQASYSPVSGDSRLAKSPPASLNRTYGMSTREVPVLAASMEAERQAMTRIDYAKSLARRGAMFAARDEFRDALYQIAEAHDRSSGTESYSQSLGAGLRALKEVEDFSAVGRSAGSRGNYRHILSSHQSKLVDPEYANQYTRDQLVDTYCQFAMSQIGQAVGRSLAASEGLFSYARILVSGRKSDAQQTSVNNRIWWSLLQLSVKANPGNHKSINEIGLGHLRAGQLDKAIGMFIRAVRNESNPVYWDNLAQAHRQKAESESTQQERQRQLAFANQAAQEASQAALASNASSPNPGNAADLNNWVSVQQFQRDGAMPDLPREQRSAGDIPFSPPVDQPSPREAGRGLFKNLKKWF